jgi:hypothetical protein
MYKLIARGLVVAMFLAPVTARADLLGCLLGPSDTNPCTVSGLSAAVLAAGAVATLAAGAAVTVQRERARGKERYPAGTLAGAGNVRPSLLLLPPAFDPFAAIESEQDPDQSDEQASRARHEAAVHINENLTNAMMAVTGAAVIGAVIATIAKESKHK